MTRRKSLTSPKKKSGNRAASSESSKKSASEPKNLLRAQQALHESEARRQALLDFALDCILCADGEARITEFNPAAERTFRISRSEALGKDVAQTILHPDLRERLHREFFTPTPPGGVDIIGNRLETRCLRSDGTEFPAEITVTHILIDGQSSYTVYVRDITARRRAEDMVLRLAAIVESSQDAIIGKDLEGRITSWNKGAEHMFGYAAYESIGQPMSMLAPPGRTEEIQTIIEELKAGYPITNFETIRMGKHGKLVPVSLSVSPVFDAAGALIGVSSIARDIRAQKLAEEALRRASETSIYGSPVAMIAADTGSRVTMWNPAAEALFGWTESEVIGRPNPTITEGWQSDAAKLHARLLSGETVRGAEVIRQKRDGSLVTISMSAAPIRDANRNVKGILGFLTDITVQKRSEEAIREAEQKYREIFENAVEGIYRRTPSGTYISANPALARMLGFDSPAELIETRYDMTKQEYVRPEMRAEFVKMIEERGVVQNFEYEAYRKDGKIIWVSENAHIARNSEGQILYFEGTVQDITAHRELEQQLRQMQKIEAVGRLAGGVAHDFNNILMAISSYAELLEMKLPDAAARRYAGEIVKATDRGSSLTEGLLTFSRKQVLSPKVFDLNTLIPEEIKMLQRLIPEDIDLQFIGGAALGRIKADRSQVQQVLMNLIINARDAMPNGGRLLIETANAELDGAGPSLANQTQPGKYVMLAVGDNGCGMSAETKSHIFEPFFTTKEQGKGTGLGLAIVFGIVKQSGGQIFVHSEPGTGTSFKIYFPLVEAHAETHDAEELQVPVNGTETILIVEDEDAVRTSAAEYLQENGYTVLTAKCGADALVLAEAYLGPIHLLLSDLIMPQMSGRELSEKILSNRPEIRVVYMSGYSNNLLSNEQVLDPKHVLLQKPFRLATLGRRVREVLGHGQSTAAASGN
jgi:two-component system, cell cycle sensor histidine kinase and response regulator CckA